MRCTSIAFLAIDSLHINVFMFRLTRLRLMKSWHSRPDAML